MDTTNQDFTQLNDDENASDKSMSEDIETGPIKRRDSSSSSSTDYGVALINPNPCEENNASKSPFTSLPKKSAMSHPPKSLRQQYRAFLTMSTPYFSHSPSGKKLFTLMILLTLLNSAIRVYFSYLARDFWNALSTKDPETFYNIMITFFVAMIGLTPISVAYRYVRQMLAIDWRDWMTLRVLGLFMRNRAYYSLERGCYNINSMDGHPQATTTSGTNTSDNGKNAEAVDNPDQRISEDIRSFTEFSLSLFLTTLTSIIDLACFSFILFTIMPQLFIAIFAFASIGTILTICIGKKLISLNYEGLQKEADFRFALVRIRENAESIAFYAGEGVEKRETQRRLGKVIDNMG